MTNEENVIRSVFSSYINDIKVYSTNPNRPTIKMLEDVRDKAIKALETTCIEDYPTCTECEHYDSEKHYCPRFCQVIKDTLAEAQPNKDCRNCKKWNECPCGKKGHENGTSIGYSIGECKDYEPSEDCISREAVIELIGEDYGKWLPYAIMDLPSVTPQTVTEFADKCKECGKMLNDKLRMNLAETSQDCISRQQALDCFEQTNTRQGAKYAIETLPSVTPERPNLDMIKRIRRAIDEMTEIHSDGEFYIKNIDAKWIISKYLYGGGENEVSD